MTGPDRDAISAHVDGCESCREVLVTMARDTGSGPPARPPNEDEAPKRGDLIGRYVVLDARGAGGMGFVLSAHDAQLDRKIALKLVRPDVEERGGTEKTRGRLLREAQLMARVRHPNVVTVYDVGTIGERIFIAMELVEGNNLRAWLKDGPHPVAEVLPIFLQAGWGLAAAHSAGVVHRDFKPENVLLDVEGHPHVTDFGIAWSHHGSQEQETDPKGLKGTPAYMSPEQLRNETVDARLDQFSFCVALYEALVGKRPFEGVNRALPSARDPRLPAWLDTALRRGLSEKPADWFPDMPALLRALTPRSLRFVWVSAAAALAVGLTTFAFARTTECDAGRRLSGAWDATRREQVHKAFSASGAPFASSAFNAVSAGLEHRAQQWSTAYSGACEAGGESWPRARVCLEARLGELKALSDLFAQADATIVEHAAVATAHLKVPDACLKGDVSTALPLPEDPKRRAAVAQVRLELAASQADESAGRPQQALTIAHAALERAKQASYPPVEAEAWLALVEPLRDSASYEDARKALDEAEVAAQAGRHFEALLMVAVKRVRVCESTHVEECDKWIHLAEVTLAQSNEPDVRAELDSAVAVLKLAQHNTLEAMSRSRRAREYYEAQGRDADALGERHIDALALRSQGKADDAVLELEDLVGDYARVLGPEHPLTLHVRIHVAEAAIDDVAAKKALAVLDDPVLANRLTPSWEALRLMLRGEALRMLGRVDEAVESARQAVALPQGARGTALMRLRLAAALREAKQLEAAQQQLDDAKEPLDTRSLQLWKLETARLKLAQGKPAEAYALAKDAVQTLQPLVGTTDPQLFDALLTLSETALAAKEQTEAIKAADWALALIDGISLNNARAHLRRARAYGSPAGDEELANAKKRLEEAGVVPLER